MSIKKYKSGFTVVELLIVIVVIAILAAISVVAYNGIQQRGRDAQRKSDVAVIQKALELYHIDNGGYPNCADTPYMPGDTRNSCYTTSSGLISALVPKYLSELPVDPINSTDYRYRLVTGSKRVSDVSYSGSADDNYVILVGFETQGGPYYATTKYNSMYGSSN